LKAETWRTAIDAGMKCDSGATDRDLLIYFDSKRDEHKRLIAKLTGLEPVVRVRKKATVGERKQARTDRLYAKARIDSLKQRSRAA